MIAILGAGPHGRELADLYPCSVLYDDRLPGFPSCVEGAQRYQYLIGAAMPKTRLAIDATLLGHHGIKPAVNNGTVVFPGATVSRSAKLGEHVHILYGAVVSHGCQVGDFTTIGSNAVLCGEVTVEAGAFIGAGAVIRHGGITIGRGATVGMGAVVVDNVPDNTKVVGNPARALAL